MANSYEYFAASGDGERTGQVPRAVHRWTFDTDGIGKFVKFEGGVLTFGPIDEASTDFGGGDLTMRVAPAGLTNVDKPLTGKAMILGESSITSAAAGSKTSMLGPCMMAPELTGATSPVLIVEAWTGLP